MHLAKNVDGGVCLYLQGCVRVDGYDVYLCTCFWMSTGGSDWKELCMCPKKRMVGLFFHVHIFKTMDVGDNNVNCVE